MDTASDWFSASWAALPIENLGAATIHRQRSNSHFRAPASEFTRLLNDKSHLGYLLLLSSYALTDSFGAEAFDALKAAGKTTKTSKQYMGSGIESWGTALLTLVNRDWTKVYSGRAGLLEVAIARNAFAHGSSHYSADDFARCTTIGHTPTWLADDAIKLGILDILELRYRLQCFLRIICNGMSKTVT